MTKKKREVRKKVDEKYIRSGWKCSETSPTEGEVPRTEEEEEQKHPNILLHAMGIASYSLQSHLFVYGIQVVRHPRTSRPAS